MINTVCDIEEIRYKKKDCERLLSSIEKRGVAIPVQVNACKDGGYECVDGNVRLSACAILAMKDVRFRRIPIMILNDYSKSGSSFWGNTQNKH